MKGKVNGNGNLLAFGSNPLRETKVEVTAYSSCLSNVCLDALYTAHTIFFFLGGGGVGGCGLGGNTKIAKLTIFAIHPCQCFDAMVKEIQLNKTTTATTTNV